MHESKRRGGGGGGERASAYTMREPPCHFPIRGSSESQAWCFFCFVCVCAGRRSPTGSGSKHRTASPSVPSTRSDVAQQGSSRGQVKKSWEGSTQRSTDYLCGVLFLGLFCFGFFCVVSIVSTVTLSEDKLIIILYWYTAVLACREGYMLFCYHTYLVYSDSLSLEGLKEISKPRFC